MIFQAQVDIAIGIERASDNGTIGDFIDRITTFIKNDQTIRDGDIVLSGAIDIKSANRLRNRDIAARD